MAAGTVSTVLSEWLLVLLIVFSLIFEVVLHRIEHWVNHKHHHLQAVVRVLYRELMVLGFISFVFIIYELLAKPDGDTVLSFEFAHVFIFLLAIFYTIVVMSTMYTSLSLSSRWKRMERIDLVNYLHQKDQYARLKLRVHKHRSAAWRSFQWWFPNFGTLWRYWQLHEVMAFHDIRFQFIFYRNLPEGFRFSSFLRRIKAQTFVHLVESHWSLYAIFLAIVLADILRRELTEPTKDNKEDVLESVFIIVAAVLLMLSVQILASKIRKIFWELTRHPRVYYEGVNATAVEEELEEVNRRRDEERERKRLSKSRDGQAVEAGDVADDEAADNPMADEVAPEHEMLDPMHVPIPRPKGIGTPEDGALSFTSAYRKGGLSASAERGDMVMPGADVASANLKGDGAEDGAGTGRYSLDLNRLERPGERRSAGSSLEYRRGEDGRWYSQDFDPRRATADFDSRRRSVDSGSEKEPEIPPAELSDALEAHETAVRHSLEFPMGQTGPTSPRAVPPHKKSTMAKEVVEAARKRVVETDPGRRSLDSQRVNLQRKSAERSGDRMELGGRPGRDPTRRIGSPRILSKISSRGVSSDGEARVSGSDFSRASADGRARAKRSIELVAAMPHDELAVRHHGPRSMTGRGDIETGILSGTDGEKRENNEEEGVVQRHLSRYLSLGFQNASIVKNLENQKKANEMEPINYPRIVKKVIPRLARVASPVEKLFWFGSHMFFMWCVEFTLFFTTVLLSAASASVFLNAVDSKRSITGLNIASLVLAAVALLFVLVRIAGIIKKYIFILHNASLVPESVALQAIHNVKKRGKDGEEFEDDDSDLSGSETEREDVATAVERRKTLGRFFRSEAEIGNMPGIDANEVSRNSGSSNGPRRKMALRRTALLRRQARMENGEGIPPVPQNDVAV